MVTPFEYKLNAIRLENFMGFKDSGWVELRPITLLYGKNSVGKSSLIRALLLLKQSFEGRNSDSPLVFNGKWIDLPNFQNCVWGHSSHEDISFSFRVSRPKTQPFSYSLNSNASSEEIMDFDEKRKEYEAYLLELENTRLALTNHDSADVEHSQLELTTTFGLLPDEKQPRLKSIAIYGYRKDIQGDLTRIKILGLDFNSFDRTWQPTSDPSIAIMKFNNEFWRHANVELISGFIPSLRWEFQADLRRNEIPLDWQISQSAFQFFTEKISARFENFIHLPALRDNPQRYYTDYSEWVQSLFNLSDQYESSIELWLKESLQNTKIFIQRLDKNEFVYSVKLIDKKTSFESNLLDTGVGISQALPVIVNSVTADAESLILVEQPELHLHPEAQAALADLFVDLIQKNILFVIETHSEHFLLRLQRRLAETQIEKLSPDSIRPRNDNHYLDKSQIAIDFVTRSEITSSIEHIYLDEAGRLYSQDNSGTEKDTSEAFNSFFRTDYTDARLLGRAMSEILSMRK